MMPSRAHTSIEVCRVVLFIVLFVMPLAQSSRVEPFVQQAVAATFTRPECQTPELLSRGYRAIIGGGIVPKKRGFGMAGMCSAECGRPERSNVEFEHGTGTKQGRRPGV